MKANLLIALNLKWMQTEYDLIRPLAVFPPVNNHDGTFLYVFNIKDLKKVIKSTGHTIELEDLTPFMEYSPATRKLLEDKSRKKGKGYFEVTYRSPKIYIIETVINRKIARKEIPTENLKVIWQIVNKYKIGELVKGTTIQEHIVKALGITRFDRPESGSFDHHKFNGTRKDYWRYYYYPIQALQSEGVLKLHSDGHVERLKEDWALQIAMEIELE